MVRLGLVIALLLGAAAPAPAAPAGTVGENSAFFARALLGSRTWSRVVRITNARPVPAYPADFHAVVFEFEGMLWFYAETDGTQGLSRHAGRLDADRRDYLGLVRAIWPGFAGVDDVSGRSPPTHILINDTLPRGCFLYCLLAWRQLQAGKRGVRDGRLLTFYVETIQGHDRGHTVLLYSSAGRPAVYDPADNVIERWLENPPADGDPMRYAAWFAPRRGYEAPVAASFLELHPGARRVRTPLLTYRAADSAHAGLGATR